MKTVVAPEADMKVPAQKTPVEDLDFTWSKRGNGHNTPIKENKEKRDWHMIKARKDVANLGSKHQQTKAGKFGNEQLYKEAMRKFAEHRKNAKQSTIGAWVSHYSNPRFKTEKDELARIHEKSAIKNAIESYQHWPYSVPLIAGKSEVESRKMFTDQHTQMLKDKQEKINAITGHDQEKNRMRYLEEIKKEVPELDTDQLYIHGTRLPHLDSVSIGLHEGPRPVSPRDPRLGMKEPDREFKYAFEKNKRLVIKPTRRYNEDASGDRH